MNPGTDYVSKKITMMLKENVLFILFHGNNSAFPDSGVRGCVFGGFRPPKTHPTYLWAEYLRFTTVFKVVGGVFVSVKGGKAVNDPGIAVVDSGGKPADWHPTMSTNIFIPIIINLPREYMVCSSTKVSLMFHAPFLR